MLRAVQNICALSRAEPGCYFYQPSIDPNDPRAFFLFEIYDSEDAFIAHIESDHFRYWVLEEAVPRLAERERTFYTTID